MSKLADIKKDFAQWYQDVLNESDFIDYITLGTPRI